MSVFVIFVFFAARFEHLRNLATLVFIISSDLLRLVHKPHIQQQLRSSSHRTFQRTKDPRMRVTRRYKSCCNAPALSVVGARATWSSSVMAPVDRAISPERMDNIHFRYLLCRLLIHSRRLWGEEGVPRSVERYCDDGIVEVDGLGLHIERVTRTEMDRHLFGSLVPGHSLHSSLEASAVQDLRSKGRGQTTQTLIDGTPFCSFKVNVLIRPRRVFVSHRVNLIGDIIVLTHLVTKVARLREVEEAFGNSLLVCFEDISCLQQLRCYRKQNSTIRLSLGCARRIIQGTLDPRDELDFISRIVLILLVQFVSKLEDHLVIDPSLGTGIGQVW
ncbi:L-amino acid oxidase-like protein LaoA, partial [Aureobasidium melanogenum]